MAMLDCSQWECEVRGGELALALGITHGSVTTMLARLRAAGWIKHRPHYGIFLTPAGRELAENTVRRRRAVEGWLRRLGFDETTVRRDAHAIEHALSEAACLALENWLRQGEAAAGRAPAQAIAAADGA